MPSTKPIKILIIDDEVDFCRMMQICLEQHPQLEAEITNSCEAALTRLEQDKFDVITLDLMMPGKSGGWLYQEIQERPNLKDIPVIVLSGLVDRDLNQMIPERDASGIINFWKPVDPNALIGAIFGEAGVTQTSR